MWEGGLRQLKSNEDTDEFCTLLVLVCETDDKYLKYTLNEFGNWNNSSDNCMNSKCEASPESLHVCLDNAPCAGIVFGVFFGVMAFR